ncbi:MAG: TonB-dependent receptor [Catalinimonas sp.]
MKHVYLLGLLLCFSSFIQSHAQPGILQGTVTDEATGEALIGAAVQLVGTYQGQPTNFEGAYVIGGVKPGDYSVKVSYLGYQERIYTGIKIQAGQTTRLDVGLAPAGQQLEQVVVVGERPLVDLESAKSEFTVDADEIQEMTARQVEDVVAMQAGVNQTPDGLQIRGARVYETQYVVDGISAQDPLAGTGFGVRVGAGSAQSVTVVTGGADAKYGEGTAGVVITELKEGDEQLEFRGSWQRDNLGMNVNSGPSWNTDAADLQLSGPVPFTKKKLTFFTSGAMQLTDTYFRVIADQLSSSLVNDDATWAPRQDNQWTHTLKLSYDVGRGTKVTLSNSHSLNINQNTRTLQIIGFDQILQPGFQYRFTLDPDAATTYTHRANLTALNVRHRFGDRWSLTASAGRLFTNLRADANGRPFREPTVDQDFDPRSIVSDPVDVFYPGGDSALTPGRILFVFPGPGFVNNGGISTLWHDHYVQEYTVRSELMRATQSDFGTNYLSFGIEHKEQDLQWVDVTRPWVGAPIRIDDSTFTPSISIGSSNDIWRVQPAQGGIYAQDEIRYKGIQATLGLRLNYWAPGRFVDDAIENPDAPVIDPVREDYRRKTVPLLGRRWKARLLPKLRVSFPINENQVLYFNYGHAMRLPHPRFVYAGLDPVFQDRSFLSDLGNPDLDPEVTVSYEMGLKAQITSDFALTGTAFYNDKFDYIVNRTLQVQDQTGRFVAKTFSINQDYARIYGLEVALRYRAGSWLTTQVSGAYQQAKGKSNSAAESRLQIQQNGFLNTTREQFLAWDRPLEFKGSVIFRPDSTGGFTSPLLRNVRVFLSAQWNSGLRYTPARFVDVEPDGRPRYELILDQPSSRIGTSWFWSDLRVTRDIPLPVRRTGRRPVLSVGIEVMNLFNNQNAQILNPVTGDAYEAGDPLLIDARDPAFPNPQDNSLPPTNPARYRPPRQIMFNLSGRF